MLEYRRMVMGKFIVIGERLSATASSVNRAFAEMDPEPILERASAQLKAGAVCLDVNIGPAEDNGPEIMKWVVRLLQDNFDNVPLSLDTSNKAAIEAGISVYNRSRGKPIVNSVNGEEKSLETILPIVAKYGAAVVGLCLDENGIPKTVEGILLT